MLDNGPAIVFDRPADLRWSVVVPVHRKRPGLKRAIESVLPQLREGMECVVVCQKGSGMENARDLYADLRDEKELIFEADVPDTGSMAGNWNKAVSLVRGEWIHLLHDDDFVCDRFYESLDWHRPADAGIAATWFRNIGPDGRETFRQCNFPVPLWPALAVSNPFQPVSFAVKRDVYEQLGGYSDDPQLRHCPDWEFLARCFSRGVVAHVHKEILAVHTEGGKECESAAPFAEQIQSYRCLMERLYVGGVQRDALIAGLNQMQSVVVRKAVEAAADIAEGDSFWSEVDSIGKSAWCDLWELGVDIQRQKRRYEPKGEK